MSNSTKAFAAFLIVGSAVMLFFNIYFLIAVEPLDLQLINIDKKP